MIWRTSCFLLPTAVLLYLGVTCSVVNSTDVNLLHAHQAAGLVLFFSTGTLCFAVYRETDQTTTTTTPPSSPVERCSSREVRIAREWLMVDEEGGIDRQSRQKKERKSSSCNTKYFVYTCTLTALHVLRCVVWTATTGGWLPLGPVCFSKRNEVVLVGHHVELEPLERPLLLL